MCIILPPIVILIFSTSITPILRFILFLINCRWISVIRWVILRMLVIVRLLRFIMLIVLITPIRLPILLVTILAIKLRSYKLLRIPTIIITINSIKRLRQLILLILIPPPILNMPILPNRTPPPHMNTHILIIPLPFTILTLLRLLTIRTTIWWLSLNVSITLTRWSVTNFRRMRLLVRWWWTWTWWVTAGALALWWVSLLAASTLYIQIITIIDILRLNLFTDTNNFFCLQLIRLIIRAFTLIWSIRWILPMLTLLIWVYNLPLLLFLWWTYFINWLSNVGNRVWYQSVK